ncbi:MAG TPA: porphobilinogen synthase [Planctomycetota bacterium]|nr:porphobilinogen synthase [Planctomycetota bacterium]OQC21877.1 MAG: Delta-aminolevulinic acid dehydratase [Planctomycetes bacterium ADurb.Bin069]NMD35661.1 porphobilinogen synthase [Planctomycetota bacterium]HNR98172.1 porphobilinogen synthase [Planctomycetota bacterium]HOE29561.1 porphobilinogen synthase [Planctomycetota bacterium]
MDFPALRLRRLRATEALRALVQETRLAPAQLIQPFFIYPGKGMAKPIRSMPGQFQLSVDQALNEIDAAAKAGVRWIMLFGIPARKDPLGSEAYADTGIVQTAVRRIKDRFPEIGIIGDVCLCEFTDHGHCGVVENGAVRNDPTLELLGRTAAALAAAGADIVAPSAMMDGQVGAIRRALDAAGHPDTPILSYAAKFASAFYGPFREAAESAPSFGDRRAYQMPPPNAREAMREIELDIREGADLIMVKPALAYLDIIRAARERFDAPLLAYNVSGEYALVKAAAKEGWIDEGRIVREILTAIRRAGADAIITYFAKEYAAEAAAW